MWAFTPAVGRRVRQHRAAIDAAAAAGIGHVVFTSHVNPVAANPIRPIVREVGETEAILQRSGLAWTVLRFGSFAELQLPPAAVAQDVISWAQDYRGHLPKGGN